MNDDLNIDMDSVLGLGRVALCFQMGDMDMQNLPQIHFILYRDTGPDGEDTITGLCLEFGLVYSNPDQNEAFNGLRQLCIDYIVGKIPKGKDREETIAAFLDLLKDRKIEDLWELYRKVNFRTALRGAPTVDTLKMGIIFQLEEKNKRLKSENRALKDQIRLQDKVQPQDEIQPQDESEKRVQTRDISFIEAGISGR